MSVVCGLLLLSFGGSRVVHVLCIFCAIFADLVGLVCRRRSEAALAPVWKFWGAKVVFLYRTCAIGGMSVGAMRG